MTDTDRTNIYSYRGTDYTGDLHDYLTAQGLVIRTVELMSGIICITDETVTYGIPQGAQWHSIAKYIKGGMEF